jgi:hypothetical protein
VIHAGPSRRAESVRSPWPGFEGPGGDAGGGTILIARPRETRRPCRMGAKYLPTIRDLKAMQRFQQKQKPLHKFKKTADSQPSKKGKKK